VGRSGRETAYWPCSACARLLGAGGRWPGDQPGQLLGLAGAARTARPNWPAVLAPALGPPWWPPRWACAAGPHCLAVGVARCCCCWWHPGLGSPAVAGRSGHGAGCGRHRSRLCCCRAQARGFTAALAGLFNLRGWAGCCWGCEDNRLSTRDRGAEVALAVGCVSRLRPASTAASVAFGPLYWYGAYGRCDPDGTAAGSDAGGAAGLGGLLLRRPQCRCRSMSLIADRGVIACDPAGKKILSDRVDSDALGLTPCPRDAP